MSNLSVFAFEGNEVRFVGTAEKPEWVAADVCTCLQLSDTSKALETLEPDEKGTKNVRTPGGEQEMLTVTEPGLYRLIFKSRKPVAKRFQRWVFHEILPAIRKTGSYSLKTHEAETRPSYQPKSTIAHEAAQLALLLGEFAGLEKSLTAQLAVNAATRVNPALKPAADELKSAIACTDPSDDAYLNATQIGEIVGKSAIAVNKWLTGAGLQYRTDDRKLPYRPTESGKQWGRMVSAVARGSNQTVFQLRWLPGVTELFQS
ncbi:BRO-N domain-containing protein [Komarekiella delphini-convector]|uniref:BRO-N domain-containing protein n=1 Tax=Komarekiella delphini-convector TaxID=3050158 RepID=UPI001CD8CAB1|nr:BRO family protein [Komarekiella delphini-convector]